MNSSLKFNSLPVIAFAWASLCLICNAQAADRVALVIGNNAYTHAPKLDNAVADAESIAASLEKAGFKTIVLKNVSVEGFYEGLENFQSAARDAQAALLYYAGHGIEVDGRNYLIPVDAELATQIQLRTQSVALEQLISDLNLSGAKLKAVVLDCCRDNPFVTRSWAKSRAMRAGGGLAAVSENDVNHGTLLVYAAAPGKASADGTDGHSPFASAMLDQMKQPGVSLLDFFAGISNKVSEKSNKVQVPWVKFDGSGQNISLFQEFKLVPGASTVAVSTAPIPPPTMTPPVTAASKSAPPPSKGGVRSLIVPDQFPSIQEALDAANEGDTVMVKEGVYRECLEFKSGVRLLGVNAAACRIQPPPGAMCAIYIANCASASIENITIEGDGKKAEKVLTWGWRGVMEDGVVKINAIEGDGLARQAGLRPGELMPIKANGFPLEYLSYVATLRGHLTGQVQLEFANGNKLDFAPALVADPSGNSYFPDGIVAFASSLTVRRCVFERLGGTAVSGSDKSRMEIEETEIRNNLQAGIHCQNGSSLIARDDHIDRNAFDAVQVTGEGSSATLSHLHCKGNGVGFNVGGGKIDARDNVIEETTGPGIYVGGETASGELVSNQITGGKASGLLIFGATDVKASKNVIKNNQGAGVWLRYAKTAPQVFDNEILDNDVGVSVREGASGIIERNTVSGSKQNSLYAADIGTCPTIRGNRVLDGKADGITLVGEVTGSVEDNTISGHSGKGIVVANAAPTLKGNRCLKNEGTGLEVKNCSKPFTISGNKCMDNRGSGISVVSSTGEITVEDNECKGSQNWGIWASNVGALILKNNTCTTCGFGGIGIRGKDSKPRVIGNKCDNNSAGGISVEKITTCAEFSGNTATGNKYELQINRSATWND